MEITLKMVQLVTAGCMALIAGLFYSYSCSVNPGLSRLADKEYLAAMQSINKAILNPWFFLSFMGTLILMPVCTWLYYKVEMPDLSFYLLLTATILYIIGVFGVTGLGNVPLNEMLDKINLSTATAAELKHLRTGFEMPWNKLHNIRMVCNIIALMLLLASIIRK